MSNTTRQTSNSHDERYVMPLEASRRGAHRARVNPIVATLPVVAVIGLVVAAIAVVYLLVGGLGSSGTTTAGTAAAPVSPSVSRPAVAASSAPPTSAPASAPMTSASAMGAVDKTITVSVYNGTHVSGLARRAGSTISADGWPLGTVATWTGTPVTETVVYYGTQSQLATAQAVVAAIGHGVARLSPARAGAGITVVVGPDVAGTMTAAMAPAAPMAVPTHRARPLPSVAAKPSPTEVPLATPSPSAG